MASSKNADVTDVYVESRHNLQSLRIVYPEKVYCEQAFPTDVRGCLDLLKKQLYRRRQWLTNYMTFTNCKLDADSLRSNVRMIAQTHSEFFREISRLLDHICALWSRSILDEVAQFASKCYSHWYAFQCAIQQGSNATIRTLLATMPRIQHPERTFTRLEQDLLFLESLAHNHFGRLMTLLLLTDGASLFTTSLQEAGPGRATSADTGKSSGKIRGKSRASKKRQKGKSLSNATVPLKKRTRLE